MCFSIRVFALFWLKHTLALELYWMILDIEDVEYIDLYLLSINPEVCSPISHCLSLLIQTFMLFMHCKRILV